VVIGGPTLPDGLWWLPTLLVAVAAVLAGGDVLLPVPAWSRRRGRWRDHDAPDRPGFPEARRPTPRCAPSTWDRLVRPVAGALGQIRRRGQDRRAGRQLVGALDALAASLRSGATPRTALAEAAASSPDPLGADLAAVAHALAHGQTLAEALGSWAGRRDLPGVRLVVAVLTVGSRTGGDLARAVEDVAATERHRQGTRDEVRSLSAQARLSAGVVAAAPVAFTAVAALADPGVAAFLLGTPQGWACVAGGVALDVAGVVWMRAITERVG
jgi:Flp pilus assembly protein TadB